MPGPFPGQAEGQGCLSRSMYQSINNNSESLETFLRNDTNVWGQEFLIFPRLKSCFEFQSAYGNILSVLFSKGDESNITQYALWTLFQSRFQR